METNQAMSEKDIFGIAKLYETALSEDVSWNSSYWNDKKYEVGGTLKDPYDPTKIARKRGNGTYKVNNGILSLGGSSPRLYIDYNFLNVEHTCYWKRIGNDGSSSQGCVIGHRSFVNGHLNTATNPCHTYYTKLRHDGKTLVHKESYHNLVDGKSMQWYGSQNKFNAYQRIVEGDYPSGKFIGVKSIVYDILDDETDDKSVQIELWIDEISGGNPELFKKSNWKLVDWYTDDGENFEGFNFYGRKGYSLIRNGNIEEAQYKFVSVREIVPAQNTTSNPLLSLTHDCSSGVEQETNTDVFGIYKLYESEPEFKNWDSRHWNNGKSRDVSGTDRDPDDPTGWSQKRGNGSFKITGNGILEMGGSEPRIYINSYLKITPASFFVNTESTVYYRRTGTDGANWGGLLIGSRSSPDGHSSDTDNTTTYYARFRHDGKVDFEKELTHPKSDYWWNSLHQHGKLFDGPLPSNRWIGMKFIVYTVQNKTKLELYIDTVSNGDSALVGDKSNWEKLGEMIDDGDFPVPIKDGCNVDPKKVIVKGNGVTLIRNTDIKKCEYKWFSVREIIPANLA